jgi:hypothetical protein
MGRYLLILAMFMLSLGVARPQTGSEAPAQVQLTDAQIQQYLASQADLESAFAAAAKPGAVAPTPKTVAQLEKIVTKHKFNNYAEFDAVATSIAVVLQGVDEKTKIYIGAEAKLKNQMVALRADVRVPVSVKETELAEFESGLSAIEPVRFEANIGLVLKYYDKLAGGQEPRPK